MTIGETMLGVATATVAAILLMSVVLYEFRHRGDK